MPVQPGAANLFSDLQKINRKESEVYRGNERKPMLSVLPPAYGVFNTRGTERVSQVGVSRNLGTSRPNRFQMYYSNQAQAIVAVPLVVTEETDDDNLFEILWSDGEGRASVNLLELFQPRNMTVPKGQVMELPVRTEELPNLGKCLIIDMKEPAYRTVRAEAQDQQAQE